MRLGMRLGSALLGSATRLAQSSASRMVSSHAVTPPAPRSRLLVVIKTTTMVTTAGVGGAVAYAYLFDEGVFRTLRVLNSLIPMAADYWRLMLRISNLPEEVRRRELDAYHHKWRDEPLRVCLDLRGFYVKVGQLCAGFPGDGLPAPYKESLKVLQENVPPQPFARIKAIAEAEMGCALEDVFAEFEGVPLGAASIGQVHRARLHDGTTVVVKVQYPECEKHFRMDFATIVMIFHLVNEVLVPVLDAVQVRQCVSCQVSKPFISSTTSSKRC